MGLEIMLKFKRISFLLILVVCFSCEEQSLFVKCPDCTIEEPVKTQLEIKIDINNFGANILISVYEGNLEDSVLYGVFTAVGSHTTFPVSINKKYTVTAKYYVPDDFYIVVDSATPRVKYTKDKCDNPCYFVYDRDLDLRLK
ncbi:MAG: hypothetical protein WCS03_17430 [Bacteroidota bacterium]